MAFRLLELSVGGIRMMGQKLKSILAISVLSGITVLGFQNCSNLKFSENESASVALASSEAVEDSNSETNSSTPTTPTVSSPKITCSVTSVPAVKPSGFVYSASRGACVPASGTGPSYRFNFVCDSNLPSDPIGIRIQYNVNYFSQITNVGYYLNNTANYYKGRSFYTSVVAPEGSPPSEIYGLKNISRTGANGVSIEASFFFMDGYPVDTATQNCGNLRNWDLNLYVYIDKGGSPALFNTDPARVNLQ